MTAVPFERTRGRREGRPATAGAGVVGGRCGEGLDELGRGCACPSAVASVAGVAPDMPE